VTIDAVVVGLGQIGMGYDFALDPERHALTHARALQRHGAFRLAGGVDVDARRRAQFESQYGAPAFADVAAAARQLKPQLCVVATPTAIHDASVYATLDAFRPRALLCEKPLARDADVARSMVAACEARDCQLFVNYIRRSEPGAREVERRLRDGRIAGPIKGLTWYSKGLFNNGSHFVDLLRCWLGEVQSATLINAGRRWDDVDPEPDFLLRFENSEVTFLAAREENFSHHTIELVAANGRLRYEQGGEKIFWQAAAADLAYAGYRSLGAKIEDIATDFLRTQWHVVDQLAASLRGDRQARVCSGADALRTLESLIKIWTEQ
jgi:predicted dehydrogenase